MCNENTCQYCRYFIRNSDASTMGDYCNNGSSYSFGRPVRVPQKERCENFVDADSKEEAIA